LAKVDHTGTYVASSHGDHSRGPLCPRCGLELFRIRRRLMDKFISQFVSIRRYRCISANCDWSGNLRVRLPVLPSELNGSTSHELPCRER
jgi:hypothetical protein